MPQEHESGTARTEPLPELPDKPSGLDLDRRGDRRSRIFGLILLAVIVLVGVGTFRACSWWNSDDRPLAESTVDRSGPVVLKSIQDLARFQAATGTFQVVVDLEKDT